MARIPVYKGTTIVAYAQVSKKIAESPEVKNRKWSLHPDGYVYARTSKYNPALGYSESENIYLHRLVKIREILLSDLPEPHVDHINGDKLNCFDSNLEIVSPNHNTWLRNIRRGEFL